LQTKVVNKTNAHLAKLHVDLLQVHSSKFIGKISRKHAFGH